VDVGEMGGAIGRGLSGRMQGKAEEGKACDVMRPPKDLPPAISASPAQRRAASATAARTAACATPGGSGRLLPLSM